MGSLLQIRHLGDDNAPGVFPISCLTCCQFTSKGKVWWGVLALCSRQAPFPSEFHQEYFPEISQIWGHYSNTVSLEPGQDDENFELSIHVHLHTNPETVISSAQSPCLRFLQMRKHRILKRTDLGDHSQLSEQPYYVFEQDFIHNHDLDPQEHAEEGALQSDFKRDTPGKQRYWSSSRRLGFQNGTPAFTTSHRGPTCESRPCSQPTDGT